MELKELVGKTPSPEQKIKWAKVSKRPGHYQFLSGTLVKVKEFIQTGPEIWQIAHAISHLVDLLLVTGNRSEPGYDEEHLEKMWADRVGGFYFRKRNIVKVYLRDAIEKVTEKYKAKGMKAPYIKACGELAFYNQIGFCEEHAVVACYLLAFGAEQLLKEIDVFFAMVGARSSKRLDGLFSGHAFVVLVKGGEFADEIRNAREVGTSQKDCYDYLVDKPFWWGESAWVADGWLGKPYKAKSIARVNRVNFATIFTPWVVPDLSRIDSEWVPYHLGNMFLRICKKYSIKW